METETAMGKGKPSFFGQIAAVWQNLSIARRVAFLALVAAVVIGFGVLLAWTGKPEFGLLYSNLTTADAGQILAKLKERKIPYELTADGTAVLVPEDQVYEMRMALAAQGLPQGGGVGFEIFDNTKLGMTEFVQNINLQRALQGELARTINRFKEVKSSRVHIVMAKKSLFAEDEQEATASVVLDLNPGRKLGKRQVQAVVHLVSSAVPGLNPDNVTVVDNYGNMLAGNETGLPIGEATNEQLEYRQKVERDLENRVETMLESVLGPNKAIVRLACDIGFRRQELREERYRPEEQVVRSEQTRSENAKNGDAGRGATPGVAAAMSADGGGVAASSAATERSRRDRTVNYEIGKVTSHTIEPVGTIDRISVAVVVDGTYKTVTDEEGNSVEQYVPRSKEEIGKLENIVKRAVSFDGARGDDVTVVNIPFENHPEQAGPQGDTGWMATFKRVAAPLAKYAAVLAIALLGFFFVVRPLVRYVTSVNIGEAEILRQLPKTVEEIEREYADSQGAPKSLPFMERAMDLIHQDNTGSMQLMEGWLREQ